MAEKVYVVMKLVSLKGRLKLDDEDVKNLYHLLPVYVSKKIAEKEHPNCEIMEVDLLEDTIVQ